jgi:long-subunit fatty acid transport protein
MKKIIIAIAVLINATAAISQSEVDVPKYLQNDITGTARYMGMAGAFGALGGDASAIKDNPAALGVYRTSEIVGTANFSIQNGTSIWGDVKTKFEDPFRVGFNNFGFVIASKTWRLENDTKGLLYSNWSFGYNRLKSLNRNVSVSGGLSGSSITDFMAAFTHGLNSDSLSLNNNSFDKLAVPWISILAFDRYLIDNIRGSSTQWGSILDSAQTVTPDYKLKELGHIDQFNLAWGGNVNHTLYLGASVNLLTLSYHAISTYSEYFTNGNNEYLMLHNDMTSNGTGLNLNLGAIVRPNDFLRLGLSFRTPTFYWISDKYYSSLKAAVVYPKNTIPPGSRIENTTNTPDDAYHDFKIQGPIQLNASLAVVLGRKGLLSGEYNYSNFTGMRLMNDDGDLSDYADENARMNQMLKDLHTFKVGGEFKVTDNFALRAGYAFMSPTTQATAQKIMILNTVRTDTEAFLNNGTSFITGGFGYREASWFIDLAYMYKLMDQTYVPYNMKMFNPASSNTSASVLTTTHNIAVTVGLKF